MFRNISRPVIVVFFDTGADLLHPVVARFPGHTVAQVAVAQKRDCGDDRLYPAGFVFPGHNFLCRIIACRAHHMYIQCLQQLPGRIEHSRRIVVAPGDHYMPAVGIQQFAQKLIVQAAGVIGRIANIKNITGNNKPVGLLLLNGLQQPVQGQAVLFFPVVVQEFLAQMPVGGVDDFHNIPVRKQYTFF